MTEKQGSFHVHTFLKQVMILNCDLFNKTAEKTTPSATFEVEPIIDFFSEIRYTSKVSKAIGKSKKSHFFQGE